MKINKKFLQFLAALWILVFHLWLPVTGSQAEQYLIRIGYVGVDIFFFLSAYSLADKDLQFGPFIADRFQKIYLRFALFTIAAVIYKGWNWSRGLKILSGLEFFEKGGGSFLWFFPAVMLLYLLYPLFIKWNYRWKWLVVLLLWAMGSLICEKVFAYHAAFIFTNRIPVILAGYYLKKHALPKPVFLAAIPTGLLLLYAYGCGRKLHVPWYEFYFVLAVVLTVGIAGASSYIKSNGVVTIMGAATLELYALQMIFGTKLVQILYKSVGNKLGTDLLMLLLMWGTAILLHIGLNGLSNLIKTQRA